MRTLALLALAALAACGSSRPASNDKTPAAAPTAGAPQDLRARCCQQCTGAAGRDPTGADISGKSCTAYPAEWSGGVGIDDECRGWFAAQPATLRVGDCRK